MLFLDCKVIDNESVALAYSNIQALRSACSSEVFKNGIFGSILMRYLQDQVGLFLAEYFLWSQIHFKKIQSLFSQTWTSICSQEDLKIGYWGLQRNDSLEQAFFHRFSLNPRRTKLKIFSKLMIFFSKLKIFFLNSSKF